MRSGPFARLMAWTLRTIFFGCLFLLLCSPTFSSQFSNEINMLRDEMSRLRSFLPSLGYPDPTPSELEELAKKSPSKARIALKQAKEKYVKEAEFQLKKEIASIGNAIEGSPTTGENYSRRRRLLAELETMFRSQRKPVVGLFPSGAPSSRLAQNASGKKEYDYCDKIFPYLARMFKKDLAKGGPSGSVGGGSFGTDAVAATKKPQKDSLDTPGLPPGDELQRHNRSRKASWQVISTYFRWCIYFIAGIAVLGLIYHLKQGAAGFNSLTNAAMRSTGGDTAFTEIPKDPAEAFKQALGNFQKGRYKRALPGFQAVGNSTHHERDRALYYTVLTQIRIGDIESASANFGLIPKESLAAEEYYRLGNGFEEAGALEMAKLMYEAVKEDDETFRDVLHRINVIAKKMTEEKEGDE